jgi:hypothetical protein
MAENSSREVCGLHTLLMEILEKLDKRMDSLPAIEATLNNVSKIIQGNGRGSITERLALVEERFTSNAELQLPKRVTALESKMDQLIETLSKVNLEDLRKNLDNLNSFYSTIRSTSWKIIIPVIIAAIFCLAGFLVEVFSHLHGVKVP